MRLTAPALLASSPMLSLNIHTVFVGQALGLLVLFRGPESIKYMPAVALLYVLHCLFYKLSKRKKLLSPGVTGTVVLLVSMSYVLFSDPSAVTLTLAVCEAILCGGAVYFTEQFVEVVRSPDPPDIQGGISLIIFALIGFALTNGVGAWGLSLSRILLGAVLLLCATRLSPFTAGGVGALLCIAESVLTGDLSQLPIYLSSLLGVLAMARFGKRKAVLSYLLCTETAWTVSGEIFFTPTVLAEAPLAVLLFWLVPKAWADKLSAPDPQPEPSPVDADLPARYQRLVEQVDKLQDTACRRILFYPEISSAVKQALQKSGCTDVSVTCAKDFLGGFFLDLSFARGQSVLSPSALLGQLERICGFSLTRRRWSADDKHISACFVRKSPYTVQCAAVCKTKDGEAVCGDNAVAFNSDQSHYMLLLSDGMGSGKDAFAQSFWAVSLLQKLLRAGVGAEGAVSMVHSSLQLKSEDVSFATVDLCSIDLGTGMARFIKAGAVSTFILREQEIIEIGAVSMPLGAGERADIAMLQQKLLPEDIILLISDGAMDCKDKMLYTLQQQRSQPVAELAQSLMGCTLERSSDEPDDDATVMVARFCKNIA